MSIGKLILNHRQRLTKCVGIREFGCEWDLLPLRQALNKAERLRISNTP